MADKNLSLSDQTKSTDKAAELQAATEFLEALLKGRPEDTSQFVDKHYADDFRVRKHDVKGDKEHNKKLVEDLRSETELSVEVVSITTEGNKSHLRYYLKRESVHQENTLLIVHTEEGKHQSHVEASRHLKEGEKVWRDDVSGVDTKERGKTREWTPETMAAFLLEHHAGSEDEIDTFVEEHFEEDYVHRKNGVILDREQFKATLRSSRSETVVRDVLPADWLVQDGSRVSARHFTKLVDSVHEEYLDMVFNPETGKLLSTTLISRELEVDLENLKLTDS